MWTQTVSMSVVGLSKKFRQKNSETCPIGCLSTFRSGWDMFTLHHTDAVFTQKHLGSIGASMGQRIDRRPLKTVP